MNEKHTKHLVTKYPTLFRPTFYFECEDGWFDIIDECAKDLMTYAPDSVACQVKEKYGTLRFYLYAHDKPANKIIEKAEKKSEVTCEVCGEKGEITKIRGWMRTLCPDHHLKA